MNKKREKSQAVITPPFFDFNQEEFDNFLMKISNKTGAKIEFDQKPQDGETKVRFSLNTDLVLSITKNDFGQVSASKEGFCLNTGRWEEISEPHYFRSQKEVDIFFSSLKKGGLTNDATNGKNF